MVQEKGCLNERNSSQEEEKSVYTVTSTFTRWGHVRVQLLPVCLEGF